MLRENYIHFMLLAFYGKKISEVIQPIPKVANLTSPVKSVFRLKTDKFYFVKLSKRTTQKYITWKNNFAPYGSA